MEHRKSKQREQILKLLKSTDTHPTANWLFDKLKKDFPNLSLGTIYRNLNILLEQKLIKKIEFGSTFDRFDSNISEHHHFICKKCNSIKDITLPDNKELYDKVNKMVNGKIQTHRIEFYGICEECDK
jgi:Fur family peroxide stress response transcriptional regulator